MINDGHLHSLSLFQYAPARVHSAHEGWYLLFPPRTVLIMSNSDSTTQSLVGRVQSFISENKRVVILGTAAVAIAAGGVAYYASTSKSRPKPDDSDRRKDKKKSKKRKTGSDSETPILEEVPKPVVEGDDPGELHLSLRHTSLSLWIMYLGRVRKAVAR